MQEVNVRALIKENLKKDAVTLQRRGAQLAEYLCHLKLKKLRNPGPNQKKGLLVTIDEYV